MMNVHGQVPRENTPPCAENSAYHILAASSPVDERTRVLKHGDTFAIFNHYGDIRRDGMGDAGLYHEGTRFLSRLRLDLGQDARFF